MNDVPSEWEENVIIILNDNLKLQKKIAEKYSLPEDGCLKAMRWWNDKEKNELLLGCCFAGNASFVMKFIAIGLCVLEHFERTLQGRFMIKLSCPFAEDLELKLAMMLHRTVDELEHETWHE